MFFPPISVIFVLSVTIPMLTEIGCKNAAESNPQGISAAEKAYKKHTLSECAEINSQ